jgi:hypothetical protein
MKHPSIIIFQVNLQESRALKDYAAGAWALLKPPETWLPMPFICDQNGIQAARFRAACMRVLW